MQGQAHAIAEKQTAPLRGQNLANNLTVDDLIEHHEQPYSAGENAQHRVPEKADLRALSDDGLRLGPAFDRPSIVYVLGNHCIKSIHTANLTDRIRN